MTALNKLFFYLSPTEVECAVAAPSKAQAAKLLLTSPMTFNKKAKVYESLADAPPFHVFGLLLAAAQPGAIFINQAGDWVELTGNPEEVIVSPMQKAVRERRLQGLENEPPSMNTHTIRTSDETWQRFLVLGGGPFFREIVDKEYEKLWKKDPVGLLAKIEAVQQREGRRPKKSEMPATSSKGKVKQ